MPTIQVYCNKEDYDKLKSLDNISQLLRGLLLEYYEKQANPYKGMSQEKIKQEISKLDILEKAQEEIKRIENGHTT